MDLPTYPLLLAISQRADQLALQGHGDELSGLDEANKLVTENTLDYQPSYIESLSYGLFGNRKVEALKEVSTRLHELLDQCSLEVATFTSDRVKIATHEATSLDNLREQVQTMVESDWGLSESISQIVNSHLHGLLTLDDIHDIQELTPRILESITRKLNQAADPRLVRASIRVLITEIDTRLQNSAPASQDAWQALISLTDSLNQMTIEPIPVPRHRPEKGETKLDWFRKIISTALENRDRKLPEAVQAKLVRESVRVLEDSILGINGDIEQYQITTQLLSEFSGRLSSPAAQALAPLLYSLNAMKCAKTPVPRAGVTQERKPSMLHEASGYQHSASPALLDLAITQLHEVIGRDLFFLNVDILYQKAWFENLAGYLRQVPLHEQQAFTRAVISGLNQRLLAETQVRTNYQQYAGLVQGVLQCGASGYFIPVEPTTYSGREAAKPHPPINTSQASVSEASGGNITGITPRQLSAADLPKPLPETYARAETPEPELDEQLQSLNQGLTSLERNIWPALDGRKLQEQARLLNFMPCNDAVGMDEQGNLVFEPYRQEMEPHILRLQENLDSYLLHHLFPVAGNTVPDSAKTALLMPADPRRCTVEALKSRMDSIQGNPKMHKLLNAEHPSAVTIQRFHDCKDKAMVIGCGPGYANHKDLHPHQNTFTANIDDAALADLTGDISTTIHLLPHTSNFACIYFEHIDGSVFSDPEVIKANLKKCYDMLKPGGMLIISTGATCLSTREDFDIRYKVVECLTGAGFHEFKYSDNEGTMSAFSSVDQARNWYTQNADFYHKAGGTDKAPADRYDMIDMGISVLALKT